MNELKEAVLFLLKQQLELAEATTDHERAAELQKHIDAVRRTGFPLI